MSFTNYLEHRTLDHIFGGITLSPSGSWYIGLSTTTPAEDGTNFTEPSNLSGYQRVAITNNKSNTTGWSTAEQLSTSGEVHNMGTLSFGTASGNWGTITHAGLWDHAGVATGNLLTQSSLLVQKTPTSGDIVQFPSGAISLRLD